MTVGRPYPTHTPLGRLMRELGLRVSDMARRSDISARTLTEYLSGRAEFLPDHRARLAEALQVRPGALGKCRSPLGVGFTSGTIEVPPVGPTRRSDPGRASAPLVGTEGAEVREMSRSSLVTVQNPRAEGNH